MAIPEAAIPYRAGRVQETAASMMPRRAATPVSPSYVVNVSRPVPQWRWKAVLLAPLELLALAWSVPFLIFMVLLPIGLAVATALWIGRWIFGP